MLFSCHFKGVRSWRVRLSASRKAVIQTYLPTVG
uniref:Uncharacterized protein n=1 Tax=Siphoviridae sp. ctdmY20 TaxID=2825586 RepID=A0A8S5QBH3_9CAUD|nr:MAG TPA: hypothetical protein [Siphoviridae sp. ctdmY20]